MFSPSFSRRFARLIVVSTIWVAFACIRYVPVASDGTSSKPPILTEESIYQYLSKNRHRLEAIEGIYSISFERFKTERYLLGLLTSKKRVSAENDMARVAILRDSLKAGFYFKELYLEGRLSMPKFFTSADFTRIENSNTFLSNQFDANGEREQFTFQFDRNTGVFSGISSSGIYSSKLSYLRIFPASKP